MQGDSSAGKARVVARNVVANAALVDELDIEVDDNPCEESFVLVEESGRFELRPPGEGQVAGIRSTFPPDLGQQRAGRPPLVRAFGKQIDRIFDLTAGLGADAYRLAEAGHRVVAYERHPAVYAVLATGWAEACSAGRVPSEVAARLEFQHADGARAIDRITGPNVGVYLDPMYPQLRRKAALPKRELQVLRRLQPELDDMGPLLAEARKRAARVVVKRSHRAPPIADDPSFEIASKLVRFDVYVNPERMQGELADAPVDGEAE